MLCQKQTVFFNRAIELDGNVARNFVRRSELHTQLSSHEECLEDLRKAQELDNNFANIERLIQEAEKRLKQASKRDYYKILGLPRNAKKKDIKKAFRDLASEWHPDRWVEKNIESDEDKAKAEKKYLDIRDASEVRLSWSLLSF